MAYVAVFGCIFVGVCLSRCRHNDGLPPTFVTPNPIRYHGSAESLIVSGGYLCLEGSPIFWVTTHRLHHRYSDKPGDPHSPLDGQWHAFLGWMYRPKVLISKEESKILAPDLYRDPLYRFLHVNHTHKDGILILVISILY